ncbi:leucine-rich repeat and transmembrane domain-containing protein 1-like [Bradysia coprophila]|uniref:leucine-rich repeat and transmembrane domain-containing protein 1-like n=1 Tax=Bradysia coprophila TaxID=38358 RepID=UPI00187DBC67|nr:leucine-rich repeat and transmembrane domain-containing protein 1-like [Bradysia coprophila]XP_037046957.1 leucine-rich repeat and transmembrane domain-containing protein 1-like [Bradysia coprophila]
MRTFCVLFVTILSLCIGIQGINVEGEIVQGENVKFVAKHWDITTEDVTITSINGKEASFYGDKKVTYLDILDQTVHYLPKGIENFFPLLEKLSIVGSELNSVKSDNLKPFVHLQTVNLKNNKITTLDSNVFEFNPEITTLWMSRNNLKHIGADILTPLKKLTYADFSANECVDKLIDEEGSETVDFSTLVNEFKTKCA